MSNNVNSEIVGRKLSKRLSSEQSLSNAQNCLPKGETEDKKINALGLDSVEGSHAWSNPYTNDRRVQMQTLSYIKKRMAESAK